MKNTLIIQNTCERVIIPLVLFAISPPGLRAQSPLDAPGEKTVTVATEIKRGYSEMSNAISDCHEVNLLAAVVCFERVFERNISRNADSDGFMLGATIEEWRLVDVFLKHRTMSAFTSQKDEALVAEGQMEHFRKIRELQKRLGIDDDALLNALEWKSPGKQETKLLLSEYDSKASSPGATTATPASRGVPEKGFITLTVAVTIPVDYGNSTLQAGSRLKLVSRNGEIVRIHYKDADYEIPVSATDLK